MLVNTGHILFTVLWIQEVLYRYYEEKEKEVQTTNKNKTRKCRHPNVRLYLLKKETKQTNYYMSNKIRT